MEEIVEVFCRPGLHCLKRSNALLGNGEQIVEWHFGLFIRRSNWGVWRRQSHRRTEFFCEKYAQIIVVGCDRSRRYGWLQRARLLITQITNISIEKVAYIVVWC